MEISKVCSICKNTLARFTCRLCGASVCSNCFDKKEGICLNCKQGKTV